jgi:hypothetical protein
MFSVIEDYLIVEMALNLQMWYNSQKWIYSVYHLTGLKVL